jgi:hypothetical protein
MGKFRLRACFDHGLFVPLIMAGAAMAAVLEVRGVRDALAAGSYGLGSGVAATAPPPVAAASAPRASRADTMLARLSH